MSNKLIRNSLLASTVIAGMSFPGMALAQAVPAEADAQVSTEAAADEAAGETGGDIVVTGTLIRNPNLESSAPVQVLGQDEVELQQANVAEELLRELPGAVPSIGSAVNNGNGGASYVNLRGVGSNRNIVLLDGRRIVPTDLIGRVDLNNIPLALIERTEVLTGGASTTYGADAIGGVVNFITRKDFAGVELNASEQITEEGDGNRLRTDLTIGANFDDGRGNAVFSIGYQETDPVYQGDRPFSINNLGSFTGAPGGSGTAVPSTFSGTRPIDPATGLPSVNPATGNGAGRQVNPVTGQAVTPFAPFNFNPFNIFQTPFERFNIFGQAQYQISDAIEVYSRGLFSKNTVETIIAPSGVFGSTVQIPLANPFLPDALKAQFCAFDVDPRAAVYRPRFTPAECTAETGVIGAGRFEFVDLNSNGTQDAGEVINTNPAVTLSRRAVEVGPRISRFVSTVFDLQAGVRGGITDSIDYDISGSYGESERLQTLQGYVLTSRARTSLFATNPNTCIQAPAVTNPATGAVVVPGGASAAGCVPVNFFGPAGSIAAAAVPYLVGESTTTIRTSLAQARGVISGDLGFESPFAEEPIGFAVGAEYRRYQAVQRSDSLAQTAGELGGAGGAAPNITGGYDVYEAFAELLAPLVQNRPFFEELTLEAGVRYSRYSVDAPGNPKYRTTTYKVGGQWEPGFGVKFRGNYSRAVRAPNISELFSPVNTGLTSLSVDPCATLSGTGVSLGVAAPTGTLRDICLAQGASVANIGSISDPTAGQANATAGGNILLRPEKADTYTVGVVFTPDFVPGLSLAVDYFKIKVDGAITTPTPGDVIAACFGTLSTRNPGGTAGAGAADPACTSIRRNPDTGDLDGDPSTTLGLPLALSNLGTLDNEGVDITVNYRTDFGFAKLALGFVGTYNKDSKFRATPTALNRECVGFYSINCGSIQPKYQFSQRSTVTFDNVDVSLLWRYIDNVQQEPDDIANGNGPACGPGNSGGACAGQNFQRIKAYNYFDASVRFSVTDALAFTVTVENLTDKKPPIVGADVGAVAFNSGNTYPSTYDALGRRYGVSARLRF